MPRVSAGSWAHWDSNVVLPQPAGATTTVSRERRWSAAGRAAAVAARARANRWIACFAAISGAARRSGMALLADSTQSGECSRFPTTRHHRSPAGPTRVDGRRVVCGHPPRHDPYPDAPRSHGRPTERYRDGGVRTADGEGFRARRDRARGGDDDGATRHLPRVARPVRPILDRFPRRLRRAVRRPAGHERARRDRPVGSGDPGRDPVDGGGRRTDPLPLVGSPRPAAAGPGPPRRAGPRRCRRRVRARAAGVPGRPRP